MPCFVTGLLSAQVPEWTTDQWHELATNRRAERTHRRQLEMPARMDAALQAMAAEKLITADRPAEARTLAAGAMEELPGNERLMSWEAEIAAGNCTEFDVRTLVLGVAPAEKPAEQPGSAEESERPADDETPVAADRERDDHAADPLTGREADAEGDAGADDQEPAGPLSAHED